MPKMELLDTDNVNGAPNNNQFFLEKTGTYNGSPFIKPRHIPSNNTVVSQTYWDNNAGMS